MSRRPTREDLALGALAGTMILVGSLSWLLLIEPPVVVDASPLLEVPRRLHAWRSRDVPLDAAVEAELRADFNLQRVYTTDTGDRVWLYVGYYGTERGGRPEHTPRGCYTGAGWGIESSRTVDVTPDRTLRANEYLVSRGDERRLVHFWFRSSRRTGLLGGFDQNVDRLVGRLFHGRADGMLVRVSTEVVDDDTVSARGRLLSFASVIDPLLGEHWPFEYRCEDGDGACNAAPGAAGSRGDRLDAGASAHGAGDTAAWRPRPLAERRQP